MKPFTTGIFNQKLDPRAGGVDAERLPLARRRSCEAVLTTQNANIPQLLQQTRTAPRRRLIQQGK